MTKCSDDDECEVICRLTYIYHAFESSKTLALSVTFLKYGANSPVRILFCFFRNLSSESSAGLKSLTITVIFSTRRRCFMKMV